MVPFLLFLSVLLDGFIVGPIGARVARSERGEWLGVKTRAGEVDQPLEPGKALH